MAENTLFQRAAPCDSEFCENSAQYQCLNCDDALCNTCKEKHDKRKKNHKVVRYSERKKIVCVKHNENIIYWCTTCGETCCAVCAITDHKVHDMDVIEQAIRTKKDRIRDKLQGSFQECLTQWKNLLHEAKKLTTEYTDTIEKIDRQLSLHATRIHEAVDKSLAEFRNKLREISEKKTVLVQAQEQIINDKYTHFKRNLEQLEELIQDSDISLLEHKLDIADMKATLPALIRPSPPIYTPGHIDDQTILTMIGNFNKTAQQLTQGNDTSTVDTLQELTQGIGRFTLGTPRMSLQSLATTLATAVLLSSFCPEYTRSDLDYRNIACTKSSGLTWVETGDKRIQMMDRQGAVRDTIHTDFQFHGFAVNPQGDVVFTVGHHEKGSIMLASKETRPRRIRKLLSTTHAPLGICSLRNGDIVVTRNAYKRFSKTPRSRKIINCPSNVIHYNGKGGFIHQYDSDLFSDPYKVAVNKVNEDLYVCDNNKLLVFGKNHRLRYEYTGSDTSSFHPSDVSTDTNGRVLVTDRRNNRIHVLDMEGKFLQYIQPPGLEAPIYIDIDSEGYAWITQLGGTVKIIQY